jgi:hypothetical protein
MSPPSLGGVPIAVTVFGDDPDSNWSGSDYT